MLIVSNNHFLQLVSLNSRQSAKIFTRDTQQPVAASVKQFLPHSYFKASSDIDMAIIETNFLVFNETKQWVMNWKNWGNSALKQHLNNYIITYHVYFNNFTYSFSSKENYLYAPNIQYLEKLILFYTFFNYYSSISTVSHYR